MKMKFPQIRNLNDLRKIHPHALRWIVGTVITVIFAHAVFGPKGAVSLVILHQTCARLTDSLSLEQAKIDSLTVVERRMISDRAYIERASRELLGVSSDSEMVIKFVDHREPK